MLSLEKDLTQFVAREIAQFQDVEYCMDLIEITDPYNRLFRNLGTGMPDEARNVYSLKDLCMLDEDMHWIPNENRIRRIAGEF